MPRTRPTSSRGFALSAERACAVCLTRDEAETVLRHLLAYESVSACWALHLPDADLDLSPLLTDEGVALVRAWAVSLYAGTGDRWPSEFDWGALIKDDVRLSLDGDVIDAFLSWADADEGDEDEADDCNGIILNWRKAAELACKLARA